MRQQALNKNLNVPLYVQLKELILGDIQNGTLSAGDMIPTEHELMDAYSVSRNVVRQAIGELVEGGYLIRKKAKGTFVSTPSANIEKISTLELFRESTLRSGAIPTTKVLSMEVLDADEEIALRLEITPVRGSSALCACTIPTIRQFPSAKPCCLTRVAALYWVTACRQTASIAC